MGFESGRARVIPDSFCLRKNGSPGACYTFSGGGTCPRPAGVSCTEYKEVIRMGILTGVKKGHGRKVLLQYHRLYEFERVFDSYLAGETDAEHVKERATAMLQVGLPGRLK
jgi:hypothetical protein